MYLQVPDVSVPVGRASDDSVCPWSPVNASHTEVVLVKGGGLFPFRWKVSGTIQLSKFKLNAIFYKM